MKWVILFVPFLASFTLEAQLTLDNQAFESLQVNLPSFTMEFHRSNLLIGSEIDQWKQTHAQPKVNLENIYCPAFFCRVEDAIAKSSKVNFKFRLGSVNYVDAMEGKGYFEATSYSRATQLQISRTQ